MSYESIFYGMTCLIGGHVLQEDISYRRICLRGGHVLHEGMSYGRICLAGSHVLQENVLLKDMPYRTIGLCCQFSFFFCNHTMLKRSS